MTALAHDASAGVTARLCSDLVGIVLLDGDVVDRAFFGSNELANTMVIGTNGG